MNMKVKIYKIKSNPNNPRLIKDDKFRKLVKSIKDFPEMLEKRPLICSTDEEGNYIVLGGNMRLKASKEAGLKEMPIILADDWSEEQRKEFMIKDNIGFGQWEWDDLANEWNQEDLEDWGLDLPGFEIDESELDTEFSLDDSEKDSIQKNTFTLSDEQSDEIYNAIADIKKTDEFKYCETFGNTNANGNALYLIIMQWAEQKK
tara:strand:- start:375 stop:983 length:609 start_codon:yes stop_codon:yes gene_type:complete